MSRRICWCPPSAVPVLSSFSILFIAAITLLASTFAARGLAAQASSDRVFRPVPVEGLMTADERQATGVMRLTPAERSALAAWVARRTAAAVAGDRDGRRRADWLRGAVWRSDTATGAHRAMPAAQPAESVRAPLQVSLVPAATVFAWGVQAVREGGRFVDLSDGTSWEVAPSDRPVVAAWEAGQLVTVGLVGAPTDGFEQSLTNGEAYRNAQTTMRSVAARFVGRAP